MSQTKAQLIDTLVASLLPASDSSVDIGSNGVRFANIYGDTLYGDGSNLTGITSTTINSNADNRLITGSGSANTLNGESELTYSSPQLKLLSTSAAPQIRINSAADDAAATRFTFGRATANNNFVNGAVAGDSAITFGTNLLFGVQTAEKMRIDSSGRVGIAQTPVSEKLEVSGAIRSTSASANFSAGNESVFMDFIPGDRGRMGTVTGTGSARSLAFNIGNLEKMRIDTSGRFLLNMSSSVTGGKFQVNNQYSTFFASTNDAAGCVLQLQKTRSTSPDGYTILQDGDTIGELQFKGATGSAAVIGANIKAIVNGTPGSGNDLPTDLAFRIMPDGSGSTLERMRINSNGSVLIGNTSTLSSNNAKLQVSHTDGNADIIVHRASNNANPPGLNFQKTRNASIGNYGTIVQDDDELGSIRWGGADGSAIAFAARIVGAVDGTPGANDMPGRIQFHTSADGSEGMTERMRIDSSGNVGIGTNSPSKKLHVFESGVATIQLETGDSRGQAFNILSTNGAQNNTGTLSIRNEAGQSFIDFSHNEGSPKTTISNTGSVQFRFDSDGLKFGSDTAAANALDDYEEGTFTPTMTYNTLQQAPQGSFTGQYQKVGNCVHFQVRFTLTDEGSGIDNIRLSNLPFTPNTSGFTYPMATFFAIQGVNIGDPDKMIVVQLQSTQFVFYTVGIADSDNYASFNMNQIVDDAIFGCYGHYYTSS